MKPIEFPEQNCVYAKDHPEYLPLPVHKTEDGMVISCWALTWRERFKMLLTGRMWWSVLTFNNPLQPQRPGVCSPFSSSNKSTTNTATAPEGGVMEYIEIASGLRWILEKHYKNSGNIALRGLRTPSHINPDCVEGQFRVISEFQLEHDYKLSEGGER